MTSKQPKLPAYLWQNRHGTFFFRSRVPTRFQNDFGKKELKQTLQTDSRREAIKLARALRVEMDMEINKLMGKQDLQRLKLITFVDMGGITTTIDYGGDIDKETLAYQKIKQSNTTDIPSPLDTANLSAPLSEVIKLYITEGKTLKRWNDKTQHQIEVTLNLLMKIAGDLPIESFNQVHARGFKQKFIMLPSNMNKKREYREKSIDELLQMEIPKDHLQSQNTINNTLVRISTFFKWVENNGYADKHYFNGLTIGKSKRASEERKTFSPNDLKKLFESAEYQKGFEEPYQYWVPLIALYTGARLEEICRLRVESFNIIDDLNVIQILSDNEWKGKTKAALRTIPMHPKLIELGLLEYVADHKRNSQKRLFPELTIQRDGYSARVSKWFGRYRKKCGINESGKVFHSLRHTFTDELKQKGVSIEIAKAIIGHADESETFGRYGKDYKATALIQAIESVNFELTHPPLK